MLDLMSTSVLCDRDGRESDGCLVGHVQQRFRGPGGVYGRPRRNPGGDGGGVLLAAPDNAIGHLVKVFHD